MKVAFAHNVYDRYSTLRDTIKLENQFFGDSTISVAHNGDLFIDLFQDVTNVKFCNFNQKTHKIGCVNGCILSIQQLLNEDFDVLIFSHDDVSINCKYFNIITQCINEIDSGLYDVICRTPNNYYGSNYYMMEVFYMSKNVAIQIFEDLPIFEIEENIPRDVKNSISPEVWLFNILNNNNLKIKTFQFESNLNVYNKQLGEQMGFTHKNAGRRGWRD